VHHLCYCSTFYLLHGELVQCLNDQYMQSWQSRLLAATGKLRSLKHIKPDFRGTLSCHPSKSPCYKNKSQLTLLKNGTRRYNFPITLPVEEQTSWSCNDDSVDSCKVCSSIKKTQRSHEPQLLPERIIHSFK